MPKTFINHYAFCGTAPFSSIENAREAAKAYVKWQVEIQKAMPSPVKIRDESGKLLETIDAYSIYGDDFDFDSLTVSVVF